jgi:hypothetical protein
MGKSRLLDELSKQRFLIPVNLGIAGDKGASVYTLPFLVYRTSHSSL